MAVNRWFFGIPAQYMSMVSTTFVPPSDKKTYLAGYRFTCSDATNGANFRFMGTPSNSFINPGSKDLVQVVTEPVVIGSVEKKLGEVFMEISNGGSLSFLKVDPLGTAGTIAAILDILEVPTSVKFPSGNMAKSLMSDANYHRLIGYYTYAAGTEITLEYSVNAKYINPPALQSTPAVADELNIVSTAAADAAAGVGARTVTFDYWDDSGVLHANNTVSLNGQTAVDLIAAGYTDVYVIKRAWVASAGTSLVNVGDILFQDDA